MCVEKLRLVFFLATASLAFPSQATVAHLVLNGTNGDWVTGGQSVNNVYSSTDPLLYWNWARFDNTGTSAAPTTNSISFGFLLTPWLVWDDQYAILDFSTRRLGVDLTEGETYLNAERAAFPSAGHPGLSVSYGHRGCNTLTGSFTVNELQLDADGIDRFSVAFSQSCDGGRLMTGSFFYDANLTSLPNDVAEPATLALLGLGVVGLGILRRRKPAFS